MANRISVAMCTYNGERYLPMQLESILRQTRLPDELIVGDDGSSDGTVRLLREFEATAPFAMTVVERAEKLGSTRNFIDVMERCTGDLIALTDQDDVWKPRRLEQSEAALDAHPGAGLVFTDAELIDEDGKPLPGRLWARSSFGQQAQHALGAADSVEPVSMRFATGATMMLRAHLRQCFPVEPGWIHDEWLAAAGAVFADLLPLPEPLIEYRQHAQQQVGPSVRVGPMGRLMQRFAMLTDVGLARTAHWEHVARMARLTREVCDRFAGQPPGERGMVRLGAYAAYAAFQAGRGELDARRIRRILPVLRWRGKYAQYYPHGGVGSMLRDLTFARAS